MWFFFVAAMKENSWSFIFSFKFPVSFFMPFFCLCSKIKQICCKYIILMTQTKDGKKIRYKGKSCAQREIGAACWHAVDCVELIGIGRKEVVDRNCSSSIRSSHQPHHRHIAWPAMEAAYLLLLEIPATQFGVYSIMIE